MTRSTRPSTERTPITRGPCRAARSAGIVVAIAAIVAAGAGLSACSSPPKGRAGRGKAKIKAEPRGAASSSTTTTVPPAASVTPPAAAPAKAEASSAPKLATKARTLFTSIPERDDDEWGSDAKPIWIEGEAATRNTMTRHPWWYDKMKKGEFSGDDWISNWGAAAGTAVYDVDAPAAGAYVLWMRANPVGTSLSYRIDAGEWRQVEMHKDVQPHVNTALDGAIDLRFVAWIKVGEVKLTPGAHSFEVKMHSGNNNHGILDCFVFAPGVFAPSGRLKPGERLGLADPGTWAFEPETDRFGDEALFDLRDMNEQTAGESGWIRRSADGEAFVLGDGRPVRFWAINSNVHGRGSWDDLRRHARSMAKRGVNLARCFVNVQPPNEGMKIDDVNPGSVHSLQMAVAAMKRYGIYTLFTPYWAASARAKKSWGLDLNFDENGYADVQGMLFFNPLLQRAYKAWMRELLLTADPDTGIALKDDPALAIVQIQNEDSLLFWTIQNLEKQPAQYDMLAKQYGTWLQKKYGSLDAAKAAWDGNAHERDRPDRGMMGFHIIWHMTQERTGGMAKRLNDQLEFWGRTMYDFNAMMTKFIKEDLGYKGLVNAGNWVTADLERLGDVERWSYTPSDIVAVNRYIGTTHVGPRNGYMVEADDYFVANWSGLREGAWSIPVNLKLVKGYPFLITESTWVPPTKHESEGPFLIAAYSSLTGFDAYFWFAYDQTTFSNRIGKWDGASPMILGQFPAAALMFRAGYVKESEPVVHEERTLASMWRREYPVVAETRKFDPNRNVGDDAEKSPVKRSVDPLAFLAGRVEVVYEGDPAKNTVAPNLTKLIDTKAKKVRSVTGELVLDYGTGLCTLDAPKVKGVSGFLAAAGGSFDLDGLSIRSGNEYATVIAVAMDDLPLTQSARVLVQIGTTCRPHGWQTRDATFEHNKTQTRGKQIVSVGGAPWNVRDADIEITIRSAGLSEAIQLDLNGYPAGEIAVEKSKGALTVRVPKDAMYFVLR